MNGHGAALPIEFLVFLGAAVVAPPLFRRIGLNAIVGYLAAGIAIGPAALGVFNEPDVILNFAEFGVVLLLFVIGLELDVGRLFAMKRDILALGTAQLVVTVAAFFAAAHWWGLDTAGAAVAGFAMALSSTAVATSLLDDRGQVAWRYGRRTFAVLLTQDLAVVPVLALVPLLGGAASVSNDILADAARTAAALAAFAAIIAAGRYLTDPVLRVLARSGAREVMFAATLLLVFGAATAAAAAGLSMALGAFLAGLLLASSRYRHELEADVEPFRGLLLALFFMGVGMSLDLTAVAAAAPYLIGGLAALFAIKGVIAFALARVGGSRSEEALRIAALLVPASEFTFVLMPIAADGGVLPRDTANALSAIGVLSMILGPVLAGVVERLRPRLFPPQPAAAMDADLGDTQGRVLVIGFGRFGQIAAQFLLAEGIETTLIDTNPDGIRNAARFGFKVYFGDGTRPDVLRAAGAERAQAILVCTENPDASLRIVRHLRTAYPDSKILVRSFDRVHSVALLDLGVDYELRETYESAVLFGRTTLEMLGFEPERAREIEIEIRRRDNERLERQRTEGLSAGIDLIKQKVVRPEPLTAPERRSEPLNPEAAEAVSEEEEPAAEPPSPVPGEAGR